MLLSRQMIVDGETWGTIYTFEFAGDDFPTHTHSEENNHITIVASGGVICRGHPNYEGVAVEAKAGGAGLHGGTVINWKAGEPHGFTAMFDGTVIVNIQKK